MFANLIIIALIAAMACWGGLSRGAFKAFLNLIITIVAACLAVGLWEPVVFGVLIESTPLYAWCLGLLVPFVLWLIVLKVVEWKLVPEKLSISKPLDLIGGTVCGLLSGIVVSGLMVLGLNFLPLPFAASRYPLLSIRGDQSVAENHKGRLWLEVDRIVESLLVNLSDGAFSTNHSLSRYQPDLIMQAALFRKSVELDRSVLGVPRTTAVDKAYAWPLVMGNLPPAFEGQLGPQAEIPGMQLVVVVTKWKTPEGKKAQRPHPTQIRLASHKQQGRHTQTALHAPVGWAQFDPASKIRRYTSFNHPPALQPVLNRHEYITWVFVIPIDETIGFILERNQRLPLTGWKTDSEALTAALGLPHIETPD